MKDPLLFVVIFFFKAKLPYGHLCCKETSAEESSEVPDAGECRRRGAPWCPPSGLRCHSLSPGLRHLLLAPGWRLLNVCPPVGPRSTLPAGVCRAPPGCFSATSLVTYARGVRREPRCAPAALAVGNSPFGRGPGSRSLVVNGKFLCS